MPSLEKKESSTDKTAKQIQNNSEKIPDTVKTIDTIEADHETSKEGTKVLKWKLLNNII